MLNIDKSSITEIRAYIASNPAEIMEKDFYKLCIVVCSLC